MKNDWPETHLREWGAWYWKYLTSAYPSCTMEYRVANSPGGGIAGSVVPRNVITPKYISKVHRIVSAADDKTRCAIFFAYVFQLDRDKDDHREGIKPDNLVAKRRMELFCELTGMGKSAYYDRIGKVKGLIGGKRR